MHSNTDNTDHSRTTTLAFNPNAIATGVRDRETNTIPVYSGGKLWFTIDMETCKVVEPDCGEPLTLEQWVDQLHSFVDPACTDLCYFIGSDTGPIKIGYSRDVASRLAVLQAASPLPLSLLATRAGGHAREIAYHTLFAEHRLHGEWFDRHPDILALIAHLNQTAECVA